MRSETKQKHNWHFDAIGTKWWIESEQDITDELRRVITEKIEDFDKVFSRFRTDSLVFTMSQKAGGYTLPELALPLFDFYEELLKISGGKVTPLVGDTLRSAGYDEHYSLKPKLHISQVSNYKDSVKRDGTAIELSQPAMIDVGAAGKGYLIDILTELMRANGHDSFIVDASGDIRSYGYLEGVIGLENPATQRK